MSRTKKDVGMGLFGQCLYALSLHLVAVVFGTAIPTFLYILENTDQVAHHFRDYEEPTELNHKTNLIQRRGGSRQRLSDKVIMYVAVVLFPLVLLILRT